MKNIIKYLPLLLIISINTYSQNNFFKIEKIIILGNKKTKQKIITRELTFTVNDTLTEKELNLEIENSKNNLLNTSLFNFVEIKYSVNNNLAVIYVNVEERWYLWPYPIFEHADRNFSSFLHNKNWNRINYGIYFVKYNFRGRREILKIKLRQGYKEQYSLIYSIPFLDKNQKNGLDIETYYFRQHEIYYKTQNNQVQYKSVYNNFFSNNFFQILSYNFRPKYFNTFNLRIGYNNINVNDSILFFNSEYLPFNRTQLQYLFASISFTQDKRDYKIYPLSGYYYNLTLSKKGFNMFSNYTLFRISQEVNFSKKIIKRIYFQSKIVLQKDFSQKEPYYFSNALGYGNYLRGFEYYVIDGNSFYLTHSNIKYEIIKTKYKTIDIIPFSKFKNVHYSLYTNIFFDSGYVNNDYKEQSNTMQNTFLYSYGIGVDFVTYYDKVFRIEYSINNFGTKGIFLHLSSSI